MTDKENGGPAFPVHGGYERDDPRNKIIGGGMTLRDYMAAAALTGILSSGNGVRIDGRKTFMREPMSVAAYQYADAMLAERDKK